MDDGQDCDKVECLIISCLRDFNLPKNDSLQVPQRLNLMLFLTLQSTQASLSSAVSNKSREWAPI